MVTCNANNNSHNHLLCTLSTSYSPKCYTSIMSKSYPKPCKVDNVIPYLAKEETASMCHCDFHTSFIYSYTSQVLLSHIDPGASWVHRLQAAMTLVMCSRFHPPILQLIKLGWFGVVWNWVQPIKSRRRTGQGKVSELVDFHYGSSASSQITCKTRLR